MEPIEKILKAAIESLESIHPGTELPPTWKEKASELGDASPREIAAFAASLVKDIARARRKALEGLAASDRGVDEILDVVSTLPSASSPSTPGPGLAVVPGGGETIEAPTPSEPEPPVGEAPSSDEAGELSALRQMKNLEGLVAGLPVDPGDLAFIDKSIDMMSKTSGGDPELTAKILYNSVWQLEGILGRYGGWEGLSALGGPYGQIHQFITKTKGQLAALLEGSGFQLFPKEAGGRWEDVVAGLGKESIVPVPILSDREKGTVLGLTRSGVLSGGKTLEAAHILVSGGTSDAAMVLQKAVVALAKTKPADGRDRKDLGRAIKELWKYLLKLPGQPDGYTFVRFAVNELHNRNVRERLKGMVREAVRFLEAGGFQEIMVPLGDVFDDSFSPSKYERKRVPSQKPAGTILAVTRKGFLDSQGTPIQKAVVEVSRG